MRQDGLLVYSTCSYSREENEDILDWITEDLRASGCRLEVPAEWKIVETTGKQGAYGYRFYPDRLQGEGFFIACLRKNEGAAFTATRKKQSPERPAKKDVQRIKTWIKPQTPLFFFSHEELIIGLPEQLATDLSVLQSCCYLKRAGVPLGKLTSTAFIPEHGFALSTLIDSQLPTLPLSVHQALQYLRKEDIHPEETRHGWTLVQYGGLNLGWIKILAGRTNNYYPKEWRILRREP